MIEAPSHHFKFQTQALGHLNKPPFVTGASYRGQADRGLDGMLELRTADAAYTFPVKAIGSYLSTGVLNDFLALAALVRKTQQENVLLVTHYVPRPTAELFISREINFVDVAGNMNLKLGKSHSWTAIGLRDKKPERQLTEAAEFTRAQLQFLFYAMDHPMLLRSARELAVQAGVSKSAFAELRTRFVDQGVLVPGDRGWMVSSPQAITAKLVRGYWQTLRPKLMIGRFRTPGAATRPGLLEQLHAQRDRIRYSVTGNAALELLEFPAPGPDTTFFVERWDEHMRYALVLEPNLEGPIVVLRAFGEMIFENKIGGHTIAPLSLITADATVATPSPQGD